MANIQLREKIQSLSDASTRNLEEQSEDLEDVICNIFSCSPRRPYNVNIRYKVQKERPRYSGQHVCIVSQNKYKSAYAKFRSGVAPIKIETGRYGVNRVQPEERLCMQCCRINAAYN